MSKDPYVSIVVPTYNRGKKLLLCISALEKQDYPNGKFEIVIVNDGSTDDTEEVIKNNIRLSRIKIKYVFQKNGGPAKARNTGIRNSKGEIIFFVDDDQVMYSEFIRKNLRHYTSEKIGGVGSIAPPKKMSWPDKYYFARYLDELMEVNIVSDPESGKGLATACCSYRKKVLDKVGYFDEEFPLAAGEDIELSRRVMVSGYSLVKDPEIVGEHLRSESFRSAIRLKFKRMSGTIIDAKKKKFNEKSPYKFSRVIEQWRRFRHYREKILNEKVNVIDVLKFAYFTALLAGASVLGEIYFKIKLRER